MTEEIEGASQNNQPSPPSDKTPTNQGVTTSPDQAEEPSGKKVTPRVVDLTKERQPTSEDKYIDVVLNKEKPIRQPELAAYDPLPHRDKVRKGIAYWLLSILAFNVGAGFVLLALKSQLGIATDDIRTLVELLFSPTVTLLGAVTGFYYASSKDETNRR